MPKLPRNHISMGVAGSDHGQTTGGHGRVTSRVAPCSSKARLKKTEKLSKRSQGTKICVLSLNGRKHSRLGSQRQVPGYMLPSLELWPGKFEMQFILGIWSCELCSVFLVGWVAHFQVLSSKETMASVSGPTP